MSNTRKHLINPGPWKCGFKPGDIVKFKHDEATDVIVRNGLIIDHFEEANEYIHFKNASHGGWLPHRFELESELVVDRILNKYGYGM